MAGVAGCLPVLLAWIAGRSIAREPVPSLLRVVPPRWSGRGTSTVEVIIATVAVGTFVAVATGSLVGPVALASPMLLAVAAALLLARPIARIVARIGQHQLTKRPVAGLALIQAQRRGTAQWLVPIVAIGLALLVFAAQAGVVALRAYDRQGLVEVGAAAVISVTETDPRALDAAVRAADPSGRAATPVSIIGVPGSDSTTTLAVDSRGFSQIAALPHGIPAQAWTSLRPALANPVVLTGHELRMTVETSALTPATAGQPLEMDLSLRLILPDGTPRQLPLATASTTAQRHQVRIPVSCADGCRLVGLTFASDVVVNGPKGTVKLLRPALDGGPINGFEANGWAPQRDFNGGEVNASPSAGNNEAVEFTFDLQDSGTLAINQRSVPYTVPGLVTATAADQETTRGSSLAGADQDIWPRVATIPYAPTAGADAVIVDRDVLARAGWKGGSNRGDYVYLARDDPALITSVTRTLTDQDVKVTSVTNADSVVTGYRRSAAGWSRFFGGAMALMSLFGAAAALVALTAANARATRREYSVLRLFGVRRSSLTRAARWELLPLITISALIGAVCGYAAAVVTVAKLPLFLRSPGFDVTTRAADPLIGVLAGSFGLLVLLVVGVLLSRWLTGATDPRALMETE